MVYAEEENTFLTYRQPSAVPRPPFTKKRHLASPKARCSKTINTNYNLNIGISYVQDANGYDQG
jgi:hypothetical protein